MKIGPLENLVAGCMVHVDDEGGDKDNNALTTGNKHVHSSSRDHLS